LKGYSKVNRRKLAEYWAIGLLIAGVFFSRLSRATKHVCPVDFHLVESMVPARIDRCLICRSKLVHKEKIFGRRAWYTGDWLLHVTWDQWERLYNEFVVGSNFPCLL